MRPEAPKALRMSAVSRKPKTFKLRALHSQKKFGVAGRSCQEVLQKGCLLLQVPPGPGAGGRGARPGALCLLLRAQGRRRGRLSELAQRLWVAWDSAGPSSFTVSAGGAQCVPEFLTDAP